MDGGDFVLNTQAMRDMSVSSTRRATFPLRRQLHSNLQFLLVYSDVSIAQKSLARDIQTTSDNLASNLGITKLHRSNESLMLHLLTPTLCYA